MNYKWKSAKLWICIGLTTLLTTLLAVGLLGEGNFTLMESMVMGFWFGTQIMSKTKLFEGVKARNMRDVRDSDDARSARDAQNAPANSLIIIDSTGQGSGGAPEGADVL